MKVMIVGGGGREHAIAWKIAQSPLLGDLVFVGGNGGMAQMGECLEADIEDPEQVARIARDRNVDLTIVGPEAPLVSGIVDHFEADGLKIFGPVSEAARIEGSKHFAKSLMEEHGIPTAEAHLFDSFEEARGYLGGVEFPVVIKADGLAAGKGVTVAPDAETAIRALTECMVDLKFGDSGKRVLIEEYLEGPEVSILTLSDGRAVEHMAPSQDHKRALDGDRGPNTGGMGAYSPVPLLDKETEEEIHQIVMTATIRALASSQIPYKGVLYGGLMLTESGVRVLEFNVRFGDPESQAVLPRLSSDLLPALLATTEGGVSDCQLDWSPEYCVCVVLASGGYPGKYEKGIPIKGLRAASSDSRVEVFHAGTKFEDGKFYTAGGRVLNVVALGEDFEQARGLAYQAVEMIDFEGMHYRSDIGFRAVRG